MTINMTKKKDKKHKFLANFIFLEFQHLLSCFCCFLCHVFVMFHFFPLCFHDSSVWCVMFNCFFSNSLIFVDFCSSLFIGFCHFSMGFFPFWFFFLFVGFLHVFIGFLLLCQMFSLFFQWFCCFHARKLKKWLENRKAMTRKWQENDRKTWQKTEVFGKFHFPGFKIFANFLSCFCHVWLMSLMFSWF